ncbi:MAG: hypothetical protein H6Q02_2090, partial [Acidobacteria bacterium]|nr:hypothetical protein [Acidobacteriota bacterium]
ESGSSGGSCGVVGDEETNSASARLIPDGLSTTLSTTGAAAGRARRGWGFEPHGHRQGDRHWNTIGACRGAVPAPGHADRLRDSFRRADACATPSDPPADPRRVLGTARRRRGGVRPAHGPAAAGADGRRHAERRSARLLRRLPRVAQLGRGRRRGPTPLHAGRLGGARRRPRRDVRCRGTKSLRRHAARRAARPLHLARRRRRSRRRGALHDAWRGGALRSHADDPRPGDRHRPPLARHRDRPPRTRHLGRRRRRVRRPLAGGQQRDAARQPLTPGTASRGRGR